jgi:uncharacterized protein YaaN involved in tellurite resistance
MAFTMDVDELNKDEVIEVLQPEPEMKSKLSDMAEENTQEIMEIDLDSLDQRRTITNTIDSFGKDIVERSAQKNQLLETTLGTLSKAGGESGTVVKSLTDLDQQMKELDPNGVDFYKKGVLGKLFNPVQNYFQKYEKADSKINDIMKSLEDGRKTLQNDNTTLEIEQMSLRDLTQKLGKQVELGLQMDASLEAAIEKAKVNNEDPEKIKFVEEEVLFPLRQRVMDLQQMQAVNQQGYFAMEIVRRNNKELIRAVERAENVTVSALRVAVTVASALYNQKIVLEKVKAINETTNNLIKNTSVMLKQQGAEIQQQSMEANITVETLKEAFANTFEALDSIEEYKQKALPQMKKSMQEFRELAEEGDARIAKLEKSYTSKPVNLK